MEKLDLTKAMALMPTLDIAGIWSSSSRSRSKKTHIRERIAMLSPQSIERFQACCVWLRANIVPKKTINIRRSSYGLKHIAEKQIGYITNGQFIAAAVACGYRYQVIAGTPNVRFGMSERSIKSTIERIGQAERNRMYCKCGKLAVAVCPCGCGRGICADARDRALAYHQARYRTN